MRESAFAGDDHLPKRRGDRPLLDPHDLPRQRRGVVPGGHSRYPDQDVMSESPAWDERTRDMLVDRVEHPPAIRFFGNAEASTLGAFLDVFLGQHDEPRVPALAYLDAKLHEGRSEGFRHVALPDDRALWRLIARGLDEVAGQHDATSFADAPAAVRERVVGSFADGKLRSPTWDGIDQKLAWSVATAHMVDAFWAHPWAWNEMGFPGPAYPRGYARLGPDQREHWEAFEEGPSRNPGQR
jgi:Gluconate 2-dehydrogenase subunit 3